jgi:organic hydroperoxide reductase OsmC/OhrA
MKYGVNVIWTLQDEKPLFAANKYSRVHRWLFDGGIEVAASASPNVVPLPYSIEAAIDPEEAFVAAVSSCHMLWFLSLAAKKRLIVLSYHDKAEGLMSENDKGQLFVAQISLMPRVVFDDDVDPSIINQLHEDAHHHCFIANSILTEVKIVPRF